MPDWREQLKQVKRDLGGQQPGPQGAGRAAAADGGHEQVRPRHYVCIGLDFGTSSTKAVVQVANGAAFAVPLSAADGEIEPYLGPTRLWVARTGATAMAESGAGAWVSALKVSLMHAPWDRVPVVEDFPIEARPVDLGAAYVAHVLRRIRSWFEREVRPQLGNAEIAWLMNMGIPARDYAAKDIHDAFLAVARAGWQLAAASGGLDVERARQEVDASRSPAYVPTGMDDADFLCVQPEVAAGVTTYVRSPQRVGGPHLFADVGATTLDTSIFLLGQPTAEQAAGDLKYVFLDASVDAELGALRLHRYRAHELGRLALERFAASDPLKPIPETARKCVPADADIDRIDTRFADRCAVEVGGVISRARRKLNEGDNELSVPDRGPPGSIQVLLSGGGIELPFYKDVVAEAGRRAAPGGRQGLRIRPFRIEAIPRPGNLQAPGLTDRGWRRLAVAYGLSFPYWDIGRFVPSSEVLPPPPPQRREYADAFISGDLV